MQRYQQYQQAIKRDDRDRTSYEFSAFRFVRTRAKPGKIETWYVDVLDDI